MKPLKNFELSLIDIGQQCSQLLTEYLTFANQIKRKISQKNLSRTTVISMLTKARKDWHNFEGKWRSSFSKNNVVLRYFSETRQESTYSIVLPVLNFTYLFDNSSTATIVQNYRNTTIFTQTISKLQLAQQKANTALMIVGKNEKKLFALNNNTDKLAIENREIVMLERVEIYLLSIVELLDEIHLRLADKKQNSQYLRISGRVLFHEIENILTYGGDETSSFFNNDRTLVLEYALGHRKEVHLSKISFDILFEDRKSLYSIKHIEKARAIIDNEREKIWAYKQLLKLSENKKKVLKIVKI